MIDATGQIGIDIDKDKVCQYIGYEANSNPPARIISLIDEYVENAQDIIGPSYSYSIRNIERVHGASAFVDGSIVFESDVVAQLLEQCNQVAVFVVTIGECLEETASSLADNSSVLQAAVLEAMGSEAVESVADFVQDKLGSMVQNHGFVISRRFSPGYCGWDIEQQNMVFRALDGNSAGVDLSDSCLMIPRKSISGIIGIGPSDGNVDRYNPCGFCDKCDCASRR